MRAGEIVQEPANSPPADDTVQTGVNFVVYGDSKLFRHAEGFPEYVYNTYNGFGAMTRSRRLIENPADL
jgi:hypothetical protein